MNCEQKPRASGASPAARNSPPNGSRQDRISDGWKWLRTPVRHDVQTVSNMWTTAISDDGLGLPDSGHPWLRSAARGNLRNAVGIPGRLAGRQTPTARRPPLTDAASIGAGPGIATWAPSCPE